ncbi:MAG: helix-turn-helix domain-containing protein [Pseudonocardiaceae bacterium]
MLSPHRARLAARLREVRALTYRSGSQLARAVGWQQSRVSKMETGKQLPSEEDIRVWVTASGGSDAVTAELLTLLTTARIEYVTHRDDSRSSGGQAAMQAEVSDREARVTRIAEWQPGMVPGLVQTAAYARELLIRPGRATLLEENDAGFEATVAARVRRQDILYQPGRRIQIMLGEAALRSTPGTIETLLGQLDRLASVASLKTVELGIVPFPAMPVMPLSGFCLHDDHVVYVETLTGEQQLYEPDEVAVYIEAFEQLRESAATGPDAVALIRRVIAEFQEENR